ncbi:MAG TPA: hypothetical protein PKN85_09580 [Syntrophorhabdaceae bacterium]|nr:hypothetical protein [Syntrophorhabdaceae bacterium]HOD76166.1 hypothetical protein [Syntrophorhabdaceae bacterium]
MMEGAERSLDYVPEDRRVAESLGWQPGIWASFFLLVGCIILAESKSPPDLVMMEILGVVFFAGLVLALWQAVMHRNRTVLVRQDGMIQVFRKRRLDMVVAAQEIRLEKVDIVAIIKIGAPLAIAAALFLALGLAMLWKDRAANSGSLSALALGLVSTASLASAFWTRFFRRHLLVPVRNSRWLAEETVLLSVKQHKLLFSGEDGGRPL